MIKVSLGLVKKFDIKLKLKNVFVNSNVFSAGRDYLLF